MAVLAAVSLGMMAGGALAQQAAGPASETPSFDCREARQVVEQQICESPALVAADLRLSALYANAQARPVSPKARQLLRNQQLRWWRQRNRCVTEACIADAYAQRIAALQAQAVEVLSLEGQAFAPLFTRVLDTVNDTRVVSGLRLRRAQPASFQLELHIDPADARPWGPGGPGVQIACTDPDKREGYAGRFHYADRSWGDAFVRIRRDGRPGFIMLRFELGRDLPLNEDIVCSVALTEWLLDRPSQLYLVEAQDSGP